MGDVAFTGIGVISSLGVGQEAFWMNCKRAKSGLRRITAFETNALRSNIAGWVENFDPSEFMPFKAYRRMSPISRMAVAASVEAVKDSLLSLDAMDRERIGVILGTSYGSSSHVDDFYVSLLKDGPRGAQPFLFPETVPNAPASHIAMFHGITGPNSTFCQNEISAENAILFAQNLLSQNVVDVVLVGGAEELSPMLYSCYDAVGVLNKVKSEKDEPIQPILGGGLILGEGAGILVMERLDSALERGAKIYGTLESSVITGGRAAIGHYALDGEQLAQAIHTVLKQADVDPADIDQIDVSANFSGELDRLEYDQLRVVFKATDKSLEVTPLKYLIGDFGGAGSVRAAASLLSLFHQQPLPTVNAEILKRTFQNTIEWNIHPPGEIRFSLMTSTTFGGGSGSLIFSRHSKSDSL
jgi:3-oxoacyl-[acyl-carrier-protein] synthase II